MARKKNRIVRDSIFDYFPREDMAPDATEVLPINEYPAKDFNRSADELDNAIKTSGQSLLPHSDNRADNNQLAKAIRQYTASSNFYVQDETASSDTLIIINSINQFVHLTEYYDGMRVGFVPKTFQSDGCKINVDGLGEKSIYVDYNNLVYTNVIKANWFVELVYVASIDGFLIVNNNSGIGSAEGNLPLFSVITSTTSDADTMKSLGFYPLWTGETIDYADKLFEGFYNKLVSYVGKNKSLKRQPRLNNYSGEGNIAAQINYDTGYYNIIKGTTERLFIKNSTSARFNAATTWELETDFIINNQTGVAYLFVLTENTLHVKINTNKTIGLVLWTTEATASKEVTSSLVISENVLYKVRVYFDGREYKVDISDNNGETFVNYITVSNINRLANRNTANVILGKSYVNYTTSNYNLQMNLYKTSLTLDDKKYKGVYENEYGAVKCISNEDYEDILEYYGECGAFVLDYDKGTIRLPKINGFIRGIDDINENGFEHRFITPTYSEIKTDKINHIQYGQYIKVFNAIDETASLELGDLLEDLKLKIEDIDYIEKDMSKVATGTFSRIDRTTLPQGWLKCDGYEYPIAGFENFVNNYLRKKILATEVAGERYSEDYLKYVNITQPTFTQEKGIFNFSNAGEVDNVYTLFNGTEDFNVGIYEKEGYCGGVIQIEFPYQCVLKNYLFKVNPDDVSKSPLKWDVLGSNEGQDWVLIDSRNNDDGNPFTGDNPELTFDIDIINNLNKCYKYYKFIFYKGVDENLIQLNKITLNTAIQKERGYFILKPNSFIVPYLFNEDRINYNNTDINANDFVAWCNGEIYSEKQITINGNNVSSYCINRSDLIHFEESGLSNGYFYTKDIRENVYTYVGDLENLGEDPSITYANIVKALQKNQDYTDDLRVAGYTGKVGEFAMFARETDKIPEGWFLCDGHEYSGRSFVDFWENFILTNRVKTVSYEEYENILTDGFEYVNPIYTTNIMDGFEISDARNNTTNLWHIFNNDANTVIIGAWSTYWIQQKFPDKCYLKSYLIRGDNSGSAESPTDWKVYGSINGYKWNLLDEITGESKFTINEVRTYEVNSNEQYQYYKIVFSAGYLSSGSGELKQFAFNAFKTYHNNCLSFGVDIDNKLFKVPTIKDKEVYVCLFGNATNTDIDISTLDYSDILKSFEDDANAYANQKQQEFTNYLDTNYMNIIHNLEGKTYYGQLVQSTIPLHDKRLKLANGQELMRYDVLYSDFYNYMKELSEKDSTMFCSLSEYNDSLAQYGLCGKYVIANNYFKFENDIYTNTLKNSNNVALYSKDEDNIDLDSFEIPFDWTNQAFTTNDSFNYNVYNARMEMEQPNYSWHLLQKTLTAHAIGNPNVEGGIKIDFSVTDETKSKLCINSYKIVADNNGNPEYPQDWTFQGSKDGETWDILDTQENQVFTLSQAKTYTFENTNTYKYYKLNITRGLVDQNNNTQLSYIELLGIEYITFETGVLNNNVLTFTDNIQTTPLTTSYNYTNVEEKNYLNYIKLPTIKGWIENTTDVTTTTTTVEAGLPNISGVLTSRDSTGEWGLVENSMINAYNGYGGAFQAETGAFTQMVQTGKVRSSGRMTFNASRSNSIYGNSDTVTPPGVKYLVYVVVIQGKQEEDDVVSVVKDYEVYNTVPLGCPIYSDHLLPDTNYLLSDNEWKDGTIYVDFYNYLLAQYVHPESVSKSYTVGSDSIIYKLSHDGLLITTDYNNAQLFYNKYKKTFYVLDADKSRFILPQNNKRTLVKSWDDGTNRNWYNVYSDGWVEQGGKIKKILDSIQINTYAFQNLNVDLWIPIKTSYLVCNCCNGSWGQTIVITGQPDTTGRTITINGWNYGSPGINFVDIIWTVSGYVSEPIEDVVDPNKYLYYKVGNTTTNTDLVDVGKLSLEIDRMKEKMNSFVMGGGAIIKSYYNESNGDWYKLYGDGWCEQGGLSNTIPGSGGIQINFLIPFKDTNYSVMTTNASYTITQPAGVDAKQKDYMTLDYQNASVTGRVYWKACGYSNYQFKENDVFSNNMSNINSVLEAMKNQITLLKGRIDTIDTGTVEQTTTQYIVGQLQYMLREDNPAGWLKCDGSIYNVSDYQNFVDTYLSGTNPTIKSVSFTDYETALTNQNGNCGLFGFDLSSSTFRVPKIGCVMTNGVIGSYSPGELPNITGTITPTSSNSDTLQGSFQGALYQQASGQKGATATDYNTNAIYGFGIDASRSSSVYGSSTTAKPERLGYNLFVYVGIN